MQKTVDVVGLRRNMLYGIASSWYLKDAMYHFWCAYVYYLLVPAKLLLALLLCSPCFPGGPGGPAGHLQSLERWR